MTLLTYYSKEYQKVYIICLLKKCKYSIRIYIYINYIKEYVKEKLFSSEKLRYMH